MVVSYIKKEKSIIVLCDLCFTNIAEYTRIKCIECPSDLCVSCFAFENDNFNHPPNHQYKAIEPLNFTMRSNWTALEELLLFDACNMFGIGNWADISEFIGNKTSDEVEEHFSQICQSGSFKDKLKVDKRLKKNKEALPVFSNPNFHEIVSYLPCRKDFDTELENDFEEIFKEVENDSLFLDPEMKDLKETLYKSYNNVLRARDFRKFVTIEKNIINLKELMANDQKLSSNLNEYKILNILKPLASIINKNDFNEFFKGLCIENFLKKLVCKRSSSSYENHDYLEFERKRVKLLSESERNICDRIKITFKEYLKIKEAAVCNYLKYKVMDAKKMKSIIGCHDDRIEVLHEFFVDNGWIRDSE